MLTISTLKQCSRDDMKNTKPSVYRAAALFVVISLVLSILLTNLTGQAGYARNIRSFSDRHADELTAIGKSASDPEEYSRRVTEFSEKYASEVMSLYPRVTWVAGVLAALVYLMSAVISAGFDLYCLKVSRRQETKTMDIFTSFEFLFKAMAIVVLQTVFIALWSLLFIIPGIIAAYRYSQSFYIMYDHPEYSAFECLRESSRMMRGHKGMLFLLQLSFIGWLLLDSVVSAVIIVPLLSVFVQPYFGIAQARFYNAVSSEYQSGFNQAAM